MSAFSEQYFIKLKKDPHHLYTVEDESQHGSGQLQKCEWCPEATTQLLWPDQKGSTVPAVSARGNV